MKKVLIINGYEKYEGVGEAKLNNSLVDIAKEELLNDNFEVKISNIDSQYDVNEELEKNLWADYIIVQTPIYWFGMPGALKTYIDRVYIAGYANGTMTKGDGRTRSDPTKKYGSGGLMVNTKYLISSTSNAPKESFEEGEFMEGYTPDDLLLALHKTFEFCGVQKLDSFQIYDIFKNPNISEDVENYKSHLRKNIIEDE